MPLLYRRNRNAILVRRGADVIELPFQAHPDMHRRIDFLKHHVAHTESFLVKLFLSEPGAGQRMFASDENAAGQARAFGICSYRKAPAEVSPYLHRVKQVFGDGKDRGYKLFGEEQFQAPTVLNSEEVRRS